MELANQNELTESTRVERRKLDIPDDVEVEDFVPTTFSECFFCKRHLSDFHFCYGCEHYICSTCDINPDITKGHSVEEHRQISEAPLDGII